MKRLIVFIIIFAIFLAFIVFNLDNRCDISIGIKTFKDIPVFLTALFSFVLGMLFALPLIFALGRGRKRKSEAAVNSKKFWGKKGGNENDDAVVKKHGQSSESNDYNKETSPYGID